MSQTQATFDNVSEDGVEEQSIIDIFDELDIGNCIKYNDKQGELTVTGKDLHHSWRPHILVRGPNGGMYFLVRAETPDGPKVREYGNIYEGINETIGFLEVTRERPKDIEKVSEWIVQNEYEAEPEDLHQ